MACALKKTGSNFTATTGSVVTVNVIADNTTITGAKYNDQAIPFQNNSTSFTVVNDGALLQLALAGPPETVEFVEDCGGGQTQHLFGYQNQFQPTVSFIIIGN